MKNIDNIIHSTKKSKRNFKNIGIEEELYVELQDICKLNNLAVRPLVNNILREYLKELHSNK